MLTTIHTYSDIDRTAWSAFVKAHPLGTVFHTPEMYDVNCVSNKQIPLVIAAIDDNGRMVGLLSAVIMWNGNAITKMITARSIIMGGILAENNDAEIVQALLQEYRQQLPWWVIYSEIRPVYDVNELMSERIKELKRWKRKGHYNLVLNLEKSEEELWEGMHKERRRNVNQAIKAGLTFRELESEEDIREVVRLIEQTYQRKHVPISYLSIFDEVQRVMHDYAHFFGCFTDEGQMIAGQIRLCYRDLVYAWFAGSDEAYFKLRPNDFTMWNVIRWAHNQGYKEFDFGGGGEPGVEYGVRDYKLKYGCEMYDYGRYTLAHRPFTLRLGTFAYKMYHKLKGK